MLNRDQMHDYQRDTVEFAAAHPKCALWLGLGFGKTISSATVARDLLDGLQVERVLIIAPLRVANSVWHVEFQKWQHLGSTSYSICTGTQQNRLDQLNKSSDVYIINRENIPWLVEHYGKDWPFDCVIIDESSSFKSHKTKRFKALRKVSKFITRMIQLTGTPAPQGLPDLWSQVFLLDGGARLGKTYTAFINRFFESDYMGYSVTPRTGAKDEIYKLIEDIVFTVDLPKQSERIDITRFATLSDAQMKQYKKLEKDFLLELEAGDVTAVNAAVLTSKLLQYANGNLYTENGDVQPIHCAKIDVLKEVIEETDEPVLIAYNFKSDLADLLKAFPTAEVLGKEYAQIEKWNNKRIPILLAHPASSAHGLNLQGGSSIMVWYGLTWSLEYYQQFVGRLDRQGQTKTVRNIHIVTEGTIDEGVMQAIAGKAENQTQLLEYIKKACTINKTN